MVPLYVRGGRVALSSEAPPEVGINPACSWARVTPTLFIITNPAAKPVVARANADRTSSPCPISWKEWEQTKNGNRDCHGMFKGDGPGFKFLSPDPFLKRRGEQW